VLLGRGVWESVSESERLTAGGAWVLELGEEAEGVGQLGLGCDGRGLKLGEALDLGC
jgi:hypothetical protein